MNIPYNINFIFMLHHHRDLIVFERFRLLIFVFFFSFTFRVCFVPFCVCNDGRERRYDLAFKSLKRKKRKKNLNDDFDNEYSMTYQFYFYVASPSRIDRV